MSKHQLGLRIDRVLYKLFQEILVQEKLRPSETIESLVRLAVQAGGVAGLYTEQSKHDRSGTMVDEALIRSRLARLKASLELEEKHLKETGIELDNKESDGLVAELTELGRPAISPELVREFEACLSNADRLYQEGLKSFVEQEIENTRLKTARHEFIRSSTVSE